MSQQSSNIVPQILSPAEPVLDFVKATYKNIKELQDSDLDDAKLASLKVICSGLDFHTGQPDNNGDVYLSLADRHDIDKLLKKYWPSSLPDIEPATEDDWWNARKLWDILELYTTDADGQDHLRASEEPECMAAEMAAHSYNWGECRLKDLTEADIHGIIWKVDGFSQRDGYPHTICHLGSRWPLKDKFPSAIELRCIWKFAQVQARKPENKHHCIFPVTIISGFQHQIRILQAYVDGKAYERGDSHVVHIRKTPFIDFSFLSEDNMNGSSIREEHWERLLSILGWYYSDPAGKTD